MIWYLSSREEQTTETELRAMAAEPIQGWSRRPTGAKTPAATGMPTCGLNQCSIMYTVE